MHDTRKKRPREYREDTQPHFPCTVRCCRRHRQTDGRQTSRPGNRSCQKRCKTHKHHCRQNCSTFRWRKSQTRIQWRCRTLCLSLSCSRNRWLRCNTGSIHNWKHQRDIGLCPNRSRRHHRCQTSFCTRCWCSRNDLPGTWLKTPSTAQPNRRAPLPGDRECQRRSCQRDSRRSSPYRLLPSHSHLAPRGGTPPRGRRCGLRDIARRARYTSPVDRRTPRLADIPWWTERRRQPGTSPRHRPVERNRLLQRRTG